MPSLQTKYHFWTSSPPYWNWLEARGDLWTTKRGQKPFIPSSNQHQNLKRWPLTFTDLKRVGHSESKPRWVEHQPQMSPCITLLRQKCPSLVSALQWSFFAAVWRLEKNVLLYDWHFLPQVRGLSPKPTKRCWEMDFQTKFQSHFSVCSFVASLHCVTQRDVGSCVYITWGWTNQKRCYISLGKKYQSNTRSYFNLVPRL